MVVKNRQQLLAIVAGAAIVLLLGDRFVLQPLIASWKARSERIVDLDKKVTQGRLLVEREESIRSRWTQMQTNTLPGNVSAAETQVLRAFDRWARASRISIASLKPQWKRAEDDFMTLEYRCDALGSMDSLLQFLHDIERDPMALRVESVEITARDNSGQQLSLALQVSGLLLNSEEQQP